MTARPNWDGKSFDSYAGFYQEVYGTAVIEARPAGRSGAMVLGAAQGAGDWSDAPTPDLAIVMLASDPVYVTADLGAGTFNGVMGRGSFMVIAPGAGSMTLVDGPHRIKMAAVPYRGLLALAGEDSDLPPDGDFGPLHAKEQHDRQMARLLNCLWSETRTASNHGSLYADGLVLQLAATLLRMRRHSSPRQTGGLAPWQVKRACAYMTDNLDQDIGLAELAALVGVSPGHFCTAFHRAVGLPPAAWLLERRIDRAREMIARDPGLGLTEVALATGYSSQSAFGAAFRRATGQTPGQWREERGR